MNNKITCAHDHRYQFYSYSNLHNKEEVIVKEKCPVNDESEDIRIASPAASPSSETDSQTISSPLQPPPVSPELQPPVSPELQPPPVSPELQPPVSPELHITEQSDIQTNTQTTTVESADRTAAVVDETEKEADTTGGDTDYITDDRTAAVTDVTDAAGVEIETVTSSDTTEPHADMDNNPRNSAALGGLGTYCTG